MKLANINFKATLGNNLVQKLQKEEFCNNRQKTQKYQELFEDTFKKNTDDATVFDINRRDEIFLYNSNYPDIRIEYKHRKNLYDKTISKGLLKECSKNVQSKESELFMKIISSQYNAGMTFDDIATDAKNKLKNPERLDRFCELIDSAKRLKKENPDTKLTPIEFEYIEMQKAQEELGDPASDLHKYLQILDGLST